MQIRLIRLLGALWRALGTFWGSLGALGLFVSKQRVDTPKVGGARNATVDEFAMHGVPRCLDDQGEKLQGVGQSGAQAGESLPQLDLKARTSLTPRSSWGDDLSPRSLFSWDAQGTQWHRCQLARLPAARGVLLRSRILGGPKGGPKGPRGPRDPSRGPLGPQRPQVLTAP